MKKPRLPSPTELRQAKERRFAEAREARYRAALAARELTLAERVQIRPVSIDPPPSWEEGYQQGRLDRAVARSRSQQPVAHGHYPRLQSANKKRGTLYYREVDKQTQTRDHKVCRFSTTSYPDSEYYAGYRAGFSEAGEDSLAPGEFSPAPKPANVLSFTVVVR